MATQIKTGLIANDAITDAKIANVALTGVTASSGDSSTSLATTAFVATEINSLIDSAPGALNTLNELAAAMGDDANFSTTVTNSIATKLPLAGGTMTGDLVLKSDGGSDVINVVHSGNTVKLVSIGQSSDNSGNGVIQLKRNNGVVHSQIHSHGSTYFNGGNVGIGFATGTPTDKVQILDSGNLALRVESTGASSQSSVWTENNAGSINGMFMYGSSHSTYGAIGAGEGAFYSNTNINIMSDSASGVIKFSTGSSGGSERMRIDSSGKVGIAEGGVIHASRFSVGKPPSRTPGSVFTGSPSSFFSEATLGNSKGDDQRIVTFAGEDQANVSGLALYRYRRVAGTNWTGDGFSFRQEVDNTANIYDYMNFAGGKVGIGTVTPDEFDGRANNLVVRDTGDGGITIVSGDSSDCRIAFTISADTGLSNGSIHYDNNDDSMHFSTGGSDMLVLNNSAAKGHMSIGYHGATSNNSIAAFHGVGNDAGIVVSNGALTGNNSSYGWAGRGGRVLHSNGTGWVGDGSDPAIVVGSSNSGSNRSGIGLLLHNESPNDDQYSPMIAFGNKSNSGSYNTAYATIVGKKKGQGVDGNWSIGEMHFDTAGVKPGGGNAYMKDTAAMSILTTGAVLKPFQPFIRARGNNASMVTNQGSTSNPFNPSWVAVSGRGITESGGVFTVPHSGTYLIVYNFYFWINNSGNGVTHSTMLYHNSTGVQEQTWESGSGSHSYLDNTKGASMIMNMSLGDTFKFSVNADIYGGSTHTTVSAYMLG